MKNKPAGNSSGRGSGGGSQHDLTLIEGVGPKTQSHFRRAGIETFEQIAQLAVRDLEKLLSSFGPAYARMDPTTWPHQASLASKGSLKQLRAYQDELDGGRLRAPAYTEASNTSTALIDSGRYVAEGRPPVIEKIIDSEALCREYAVRQKDLEEELKKAEKALRSMRKQTATGAFGKVQACFVAFRQKYGRIVSPLQYVVTVAVPYKIADDRLADRRIQPIPKQCGDVSVKVVESRPFLLSAIGELASHSGPPPHPVFPGDATSFSETSLAGGVPCSMYDEVSNWGTLGICYKKGAKTYAIVNAHFADENAKMVQPPENTFSSSSGHEIGTVTKSEFLKTAPGGGSIDAAVIELDSSTARRVSERIILSHASGTLIDKDVFFAKDRLDRPLQRVFKVGARTKFTSGRVDVVNFPELEIGQKKARKIIRFINQSNNTIVDDGDSGSVLAADIEEGILVVGLVFAGDRADSKIGYACHIADVIEKLSLRIPAAKLKRRPQWKFVD